MYPLIYSS